jgi:hypothetical protein
MQRSRLSYSILLVLLTAASLVALPGRANGQTGAASITGIVTDSTGAALPGVVVVALNEATMITYSAVSNEAGAYIIASLPVGVYNVSAALPNFGTVVTKPMTLEASQIARVDLRLSLGRMDETIYVFGASPLFQTEKATVGEIVSGTTATTLPLNGRNTGQLTLLLPGVITPDPSSFATIKNFTAGRPFVNGNREQTNNYMLDGVDMNESIDNLVPYQPSPDALAEISVETSNYSAELGNVAGAVINNVTKSGTNDPHGNVFEFYRDSRLDATSWAFNRSAAGKPDRTQHIFGATVGGPIVRNRIFFFGDFQGVRLDDQTPGLVAVAPAAWRRGDFSALSGVTIVDPLTGQPFPGNRIPASRISPIAQALLDTSLYPLPNRTVTGVSGNYVGTRVVTTRERQGDVKVDLNLSSSDSVLTRYSQAEYTFVPQAELMPLFMGTRNDAPTRNFGLNWNRTFGPWLTNEVLVGYNDVRIVRSLVDLNGLGRANARFGIPGDQAIAGLSAIRFGGGLNAIGDPARTWDTRDRTYQFNERITWSDGRHTMKLGGQLLHLSQRRYYSGNNGALGLFSYTGTFTGFGFSDFLLDQLSQKGRGSVAPPWTQLHERVAAYAQDDFKVAQNLTLNLGLRWAFTSPLVEQDDRQANVDLHTGQLLLAGQNGNSRALYNPYYKGFEPRLGLAWTPSERWVLRGAYGIVQYMEGTGANARLTLNPPFFFESDVRYDQTTGPGTIRTGFEGLTPLDQPAGQLRAADPNRRPQFTQQWNLFAERLLSDDMSLSIGYVGHHATQLAAPVEANQPLPGAGPVSTWLPLQQRRPLYAVAPLITNISTTTSRGRSNFNSLQSSVRRRLAAGLEFLASYTLSRTMTNSLGYYGAGAVVAESNIFWQNAYDDVSEYGPASWDATHNFVLSGTYEVPFGRERQWGTSLPAVVDALLGGWSLSGIFQKRSGFPITVLDGRGSSLQATHGFERPDRIGSGEVANPTLDHWIDITAFQRAAPGTWGDSGVGILRAPGYMNLDLALGKRFPIGAKRSAQIRAEAFNALNKPAFGPPGRQLDSPNTFGVITTTINTPRTFELVGKIFF